VLRDYTYLVKHLGSQSWGRPRQVLCPKLVRRILSASRIAFVFGLLYALTGLFPTNQANQVKEASLFPLFHTAPVQATTLETVTEKNHESSVKLSQWPALFEVAKHRPSSKSLLTANPPSRPVKKTVVTTTTPDAPVSGKIKPQVGKIQMASTPAKKGGFVVRSDGDDMVVYDADGNEVYRKASKQANLKSAIAAKKKEPKENTREKIETPARTKSPHGVKEEPSQRSVEGPLAFTKIKRGENLSVIAERYAGVSAEDLMRVNQIDDPYSIPAGVEIWVPTRFDGVCHRVEKGETLSQLLNKYNIRDLFQVCDINGLRRTQNALKDGSLLVLPNASPRVAKQAKSSRIPKNKLAGVKGNSQWIWPFEGQYKKTSPYGLRHNPFKGKKKGVGGGKKKMHHGVDFGMPSGTEIFAVRDGEVIEVSRSRRGHGNMIKIRHDDDWCTVYSHNKRIAKKVGDRVKQGELISHSGNTGRSTGPHLHFEIRRPDQKSVNPESLLGPAPAK